MDPKNIALLIKFLEHLKFTEAADLVRKDKDINTIENSIHSEILQIVTKMSKNNGYSMTQTKSSVSDEKRCEIIFNVAENQLNKDSLNNGFKKEDNLSLGCP